MKLHVAEGVTGPCNDVETLSGLQLYQHWVQLAQRVRDDRSIPEDKRLHAMILLEGLGMMDRRSPLRADRSAPQPSTKEAANG